jgi:NTE family protein
MKALVLGGGGAKGAYQVGALRHLLRDAATQYPIVTGTSVGALNGAYLAMFPLGQEPDAYDGLDRLWRGVNDRKVWRPWYHGLLWMAPVMLPRWLGGRQSVYSTAPLRELVREHFDPAAVTRSGRILRIGAVDLGTGKRHTWSEQDTDELEKAVLASSSFPFFFEPVRDGPHLFTDDGVREITPVECAIRAGATDIDVISTNPEPLDGGFDVESNGRDLGQRILDTMSAEIEHWDIKATELYNALVLAGKCPDRKLVRLRVLRPDKDLLKDALDFDPDKIRDNMELGYAHARDDSRWRVTDPSPNGGPRQPRATDGEQPGDQSPRP